MNQISINKGNINLNKDENLKLSKEIKIHQVNRIKEEKR